MDLGELPYLVLVTFLAVILMGVGLVYVAFVRLEKWLGRATLSWRERERRRP